MNDYNMQIILVALVAHRRFDGGSENRVTNFAEGLFNRFDAQIRASAGNIGRTLDANERSAVAAIAAMVGGSDRDAADEAVTTFVSLFSR